MSLLTKSYSKYTRRSRVVEELSPAKVTNSSMNNPVILSGLRYIGLPLPKSRAKASYIVCTRILNNISIGSFFSVNPDKLMFYPCELKSIHLLNVSDQPYLKDQIEAYQKLGCSFSEVSLENDLDYEHEDEEDDIVIMEKLEMGYRHLRKILREEKYEPLYKEDQRTYIATSPHVIIHCRAGSNRSVVMLVYYLLRRIYRHPDALLMSDWLTVIVDCVSAIHSCTSIAFGYTILLRDLERLLRFNCKRKHK